MYPTPAVVTVIAETVSPVRVEVASALAVVPNPTGVSILTLGAEVYPVPPAPIVIEETVPATETTAVADAPTILF